jgi:hypothetical protein
LVPKGGGHRHHSTILLRRGKNQGAPSEDHTFFYYYRYLHLYLYYYCSQLFYSYYYEAESKLGSRNSKLQLRSSLLIFCPLSINYKDPPIYRDGGRWRFSPKPLVVIFFRAPGGRGIYKKLLEPTQRPTNPYMGWATPPTPALWTVGGRDWRWPTAARARRDENDDEGSRPNYFRPTVLLGPYAHKIIFSLEAHLAGLCPIWNRRFADQHQYKKTATPNPRDPSSQKTFLSNSLPPPPRRYSWGSHFPQSRYAPAIF